MTRPPPGQSGLVAVDGQIFSPEKAAISVLDRGFLFGDSVFEVCVAFGGRVLGVDQHLARLRTSAESLALDIPWSDAELAFELTTLAEQVAEPKAYLRLVVTRGDGMGVRIPAASKPRRITYCMKAAVEAPRTYTDGISLKRLVKSSSSRGAAPKTSNYLESVLALRRAEQEGFDDVLWTNGEGEVTEASTANIFFLAREGDNVEFVTPSAQSGILVGITRATVISLLRNAKIPVSEQIIHADELARFDEAFVCSTVRGLVPIREIDKHRLFTMRPASTYRHIERLFLTWAETQIGYRVDWATGAKATK